MTNNLDSKQTTEELFSQDWEKEFSKEFTDNVLKNGYGNDLITDEANEIMDFISRLLTFKEKEVVDRIKKHLWRDKETLFVNKVDLIDFLNKEYKLKV